MKNILAAAAAVACCFITPAFAEVGDKLIDDGDLNPADLGIEYFANRYEFKPGDSIACAYGYAAEKAASHEAAQKIFKKCVAAGVEAALPWESYMSQNGFGTRMSAEDAAEWDRKSAEHGYKIGQFNYGLDKLRGFGVAQDLDGGKKLIDAAAAQGLDIAKAVQESDYNPEVAIPDADEHRIY